MFLLSAPRRLCAPSFVLLMASLAFSLIACPDAHAGTYTWTTTNPTTGAVIAQSPTFTGGTVTVVSSGPKPITKSPPPPPAFTTSNGVYAGGGGCMTTSVPPLAGPGSVTIPANPIVATFTWQPAAGQTSTTDPPPPAVIVQQNCTAQWDAETVTGTATPGGTANRGLPGATVSPTIGVNGMVLGVTSSGVAYSVVTTPGGSFSVPAQGSQFTPTASFTPTAGNGAEDGGASVSYQVQAFPVIVTPSGSLGGAIKDSSGSYNILVGQYCAASLVGIPLNCTVSNYQWGVTGPTFQTWQSQTPAIGNNPANLDASYEVDGPGPLTNPTASWYWNERLTTSEVVSCSATVTPPAGQGGSFTVNATTPILVYRPNWTATGVGGYVKVRLLSGTIYEIMAGPTATQLANGLMGGMNFTATVTSPNTSLFGNGSLGLAQLCTPGRSFTSAQGDYTYSQNGQEGSDGDYPYGWNVNGPVYQTDDLPGNGLADYLMANFTMQDQFEDFLMYYAPGSVQAVPLAHFTWSTNGYAVLPHSGTWSTYVTQNGSDNAGTVSPSGNTATFLLSNTFPGWTQITGTGTFGITSPVG
jgi:hypothetical protein